MRRARRGASFRPRRPPAAARHAARRLARDAREQESPARPRVVSRQRGELAVETLEAQAHPEAFLVFDEEPPARLDRFLVERLGDAEARGVLDRRHASAYSRKFW